MVKYCLITTTLFALIIMPASGGAAESLLDKIAFSGDAGISMPLGDADDFYNVGFVVGVNGFYPYSDNIHFGGRVAYNRWGVEDEGWGENTEGYGSMMEFVPQVRYLFSPSETADKSFFLQGGLGFYRYAYDFEWTGPDLHGGTAEYSNDGSEIELGLCLGGGVAVELAGGSELEFKPMINIVFTEGESTKYFTLTVGMAF